MGKYNTVINFLNAHESFIITAHETPDGDAIGSECAMYHTLMRMNKKARIFNSDPMAEKYRYMDPDGFIEVLSSSEQLPVDLESWGLLILDTNDTNNIGEVADLILPVVNGFFIIDHHESEKAVIRDNLVEEEASSTCEVLYELIRELDMEPDYPTAIALFTGIVYDTGSFIYPKTSVRTFEIARNLVACGVSPNYIYSKIYESNSISALMLQSRVLSTLELYFNQHVSVLTMERETLEQCGAIYEESDSIINIPLKSESIKVSVFFKENEAGILRCSMRSKGNIDVAQIAQSFEGGGHKTAAGFKSKVPLEIIKKKVLEMLEEYFPGEN